MNLHRAAPSIPRTVLVLSGTHLINDIFGNIYAPLLPLFIPRLHLSLAAAGAIAAAIQIAGSIAQLVFGPLADRWRPRVLAVAGPLVAVAFMSLAGLATSPLMLGAILVAGCLGSAAFHPTAAAIVNRVGGERRGTAMSVHVTGGAMGNALAPLIFAPYAAHVGITWTPLLAIPALLLLVFDPARRPRRAAGTRRRAARVRRAAARTAVPLALLWSAVVIRTVVAIGFSTFLPVVMTGRGLSVSEAGFAVSAYLLAGQPRRPCRRPVRGSVRPAPRDCVVAALLGAAALLRAARDRARWRWRCSSAGGFFLGSTLPVNITYAHMIAPVATGTVSSLMLGVAWGVGGLAVPLVGLAGDHVGLQPALLTLRSSRARGPADAARAGEGRRARRGGSRGAGIRELD